MKQQIKLTESDLHSLIEGAVRSILKEYGDRPETRKKMADAAKRSIKDKGDASTYHNAINSLHKRGSSKQEMGDFQEKFEENTQKECGNIKNIEEEDEDFNEQPTNDVVGENKNQMKITESQLFDVIRESVKSVLAEIGDTHKFGQGKFGLAMDAASKARALGRRQQADNLTKHGADAFNKDYSTNGFEMDEFGQLRHRGEDNQERLYRPKSKINFLQRQKDSGLQGAETELDKALRKNSYIKNAAQTAKAFPRKKMTGGLNAIDTVDKGIHGNDV